MKFRKLDFRSLVFGLVAVFFLSVCTFALYLQIPETLVKIRNAGTDIIRVKHIAEFVASGSRPTSGYTALRPGEKLNQSVSTPLFGSIQISLEIAKGSGELSSESEPFQILNCSPIADRTRHAYFIAMSCIVIVDVVLPTTNCSLDCYQGRN